MAYQVTTGPSSEPITLADAKHHLKVETSVTADDDLITALIAAARQTAEQYTGRALLTQTIEQVYTRFPITARQSNYNYINLWVAPVQSVTSVTYNDTDGNTQTWDSDKYYLNTVHEPARLSPVAGETWPDNSWEPGNVKVTYQAGYSSVSDIPKPIIQAMYLMIGDWYEKRSDTMRRMPTAAEFLMNHYRLKPL